MDIKDNCDFSCWVVKYDPVRIPGRIYQKDSLKWIDGKTVPLLVNHDHNNMDSLIGTALLENRAEGVYAYCILSDTPFKEAIIDTIRNRRSVFLSPFINQVKRSGDFIEYGVIKEVSLVRLRIDPDGWYCPVMKQDDECDQ